MGERKHITAAILTDGGWGLRVGVGGEVEGGGGARIDPQNTLPHVESIRNNLVFYPPLQKKGGFSACVCVRERERKKEYTSESEVGKVKCVYFFPEARFAFHSARKGCIWLRAPLLFNLQTSSTMRAGSCEEL